MIRKYELASFYVDSAGGAGETGIGYTLVFTERGEIVVEEHRSHKLFGEESTLEIRPEQFDNYTINGVTLRQLVH